MIDVIPLIHGITADSRDVQQGFLFVALKGVKADGINFIEDALKKGASAIAVTHGTEKPDYFKNYSAQWIEVDNTHLYLAQMAARFYKMQPDFITAVTGTNGKTSTVNFARMIWSLLGQKSASLGTLGLISDGVNLEGVRTTPDPVSLFKTLAQLQQNGITHLSMEASSHGLHQYRLDSVRLKVAGFTNLTRDHLDYHGTMENYFQAKLRLFTEVLEDEGVAVLNADSPYTSEIKKNLSNRSIRIMTYGHDEDSDIRIMNRKISPQGQDLTIKIDNQLYDVHLNLVGEFQAMNLLCAAGLVAGCGQSSWAEIMSVLGDVKGVIGRLQPIPHAIPKTGVYIDYAHTPDGLETILKSLRPHVSGRLIVVFGCGGDRDKGKRPIMGGIASQLADVTIITDDNPRTEDASVIRQEILMGASQAIEIGGRREAIQHAVRLLQSGDILVVAGKGHEQGQIFSNHTESFDDFTETQSALNSLKHSSSTSL